MSLISDQWIFYGKTDAETLMGAAYRWFTTKGFSNGGFNQRWTEYLASLGYTQSFPECLRLYYTAMTGKDSYQEAENAFFLPRQVGASDSIAARDTKTVSVA